MINNILDDMISNMIENLHKYDKEKALLTALVEEQTRQIETLEWQLKNGFTNKQERDLIERDIQDKKELISEISKLFLSFAFPISNKDNIYFNLYDSKFRLFLIYYIESDGKLISYIKRFDKELIEVKFKKLSKEQKENLEEIAKKYFAFKIKISEE